MKSYYQGRLIVKPNRAEVTRDTDAVSKMDPYIQIKVGTVTQRTKSHEGGGKTPSWPDVFEFERKTEDVLSFEIYDDDPGADDLVGTGSINLDKICGDKPRHFEEPVKVLHKDKDIGKVFFSIDFVPDVKKSGGPKKDSPRAGKPREDKKMDKRRDDKGRKGRKSSDESDSGSDDGKGRKRKGKR